MDVEFLRCRFEDGHDGVIVKNKFRLGVRHIQIVYMLLCAMTLGALRGSTGVALLALTDRGRTNDTYIQVYNWDGRIQGAILSSFLFGYALMLVPAELFARRVKTGGKHVLTAVLVVSGALAVAMPTIVHKGGWIAVCNAQLWMGAAQAWLVPSNQSLLAKYMTPNERNFFGFLVHSGSIVGIMVGISVSGQISEADLGWELVFYSQAMLALSVACLWGLLTASTPQKHEAMGNTEREFIKSSLSTYRKKSLQVPWRSILESHHFWAAAIAHAACNSVFVFFLFYLVPYLQTFSTSLKDSSFKAHLVFGVCFIWLGVALPIDACCRMLLTLRYEVKLTHLRKVINTFGALGVIGGLVLVPNLSPESPRLAVTVAIAVLAMLALQLCGFLESFKDMSDNFHGSLLMLSRTVASVVGAAIPVITGVLLADDFNDLKRWRGVFLSLASLCAACNAVYLVAGSSERQHWDGGGVFKTKFGYHNATIGDNQVELEELSTNKTQAPASITVNTTI